MKLAQAVDPNVTSPTIAGFQSDTLLWIILIVAALIIAYIVLSGFSRDRYTGTKGGRVKRVIEYEDEDEI